MPTEVKITKVEETDHPFRYFISYSWAERDKSGFGSTEIRRYKKIESWNDIEIIKEKLKEGFSRDVSIVIIQYQLMG